MEGQGDKEMKSAHYMAWLTEKKYPYTDSTNAEWQTELSDHPGEWEAAADMDINPDFHYISEERGNEWPNSGCELNILRLTQMLQNGTVRG